MKGGDDLLVYGAGGHAKVVIEAAQRQGVHECFGIVDDDPEVRGERILGVEVLGGEEALGKLVSERGREFGFVVALGSNAVRAEIAAKLTGMGLRGRVVAHPASAVGREVVLGEGTVVIGAMLNPGSVIGGHCILNTHCSVDHDCRIGDVVHVGPGARLCGTVTVGSGTFVGAGAVVLENLKVGENCVIGAGAVVTRNLQDGAKVVGVPARAVTA